MNEIKKGNIVKGLITGITDYGIFLKLNDEYGGLVHISEISDNYISNINVLYRVDDVINVYIVDVFEKEKKCNLSIKAIDYKSLTNISKIPESKSGFKPLKDNLSKWTREKYNEIHK